MDESDRKPDSSEPDGKSTVTVRTITETMRPPPLAIEAMSLDLACQQRDEALARVRELEELLAGYDELASEAERLRVLMQRIATIVGCAEFESLEAVVISKMTALEAMMQEEIRTGLQTAARIAALGVVNERVRQLEEEVARLKARS